VQFAVAKLLATEKFLRESDVVVNHRTALVAAHWRAVVAENWGAERQESAIRRLAQGEEGPPRDTV
jgi:hypothetical protein